MLAPWFDPASPFGALIAEPDVLLPAFVRALRFEMEAYRSEPWLAEMLAHLQAELPLFRDHWLRAEENGVKMPSFFGYMGWSIAVLIPLFVAVTFVIFR